MVAVPGLLMLCLQSRSAEFVPARDYPKKSVEEWVQVLHGASEQRMNAVWSLYYGEARTDAVIEGLKAALATSSTSTSRAIDTVLNHWSVPFEMSTAEAYAKNAKKFRSPGDVFAPPLELLATLDERDAEPRRTIERAIRALQSGEDAADVLDTLVEFDLETEARTGLRPEEQDAVDRSLAWAREFAGRAWGEAVGRVVSRLAARTSDAEAVAGLLDRVTKLNQSGLADAKTLAVAKTLGADLRALILPKLFRWQVRPLEDHALHRVLEHRGERDEDEGELLAEYALSELRTSLDAEVMRRHHASILIVPTLAARLEPELLELAKHDDAAGLEALRILCHLGTENAEMRARYLEVMRQASSLDANAIPCWKHHDEETIAALAAAMERAEDKRSFQTRLRFGGLTDARRHPIVASYLSDPKIRSHGAWLVSEGFLGLFPLESDHRVAGLVNQIALRIATLKASNADYSAEADQLAAILLAPYEDSSAGGYNDHVQWGFFHARELELHSNDIVRAAFQHLSVPFPYGVHVDAANAYLDTARLTLDQEIELRRLRKWEPPDSRTAWGINIVHPTLSGPLHGRLALELVPEIRLAVYTGSVRAIEDLLAVTSMVARDEDYLLAALERGPADLREWALDLVERHELDGDRLASAVRSRRADLDGAIRAAADRLAAARGW